MHVPALLTWIGGVAEESAVARPSSETLVNPNTGEVLAESRASSREQVDRAIAAAHAAHADARWRGMPVDARAEILERFAVGLEAVADEMAMLDALNSGVPVSVTRLFAYSAGDTVRGAITHGLALGDERSLDAGERDVRVRRVPWGPTALITPWNAPSAMAVKKLAYALAAGATAVLKPSPASPFSAQLVVRAAADAGVPEGVVSLVLGGGEVGAALTADTRIAAISMTGSTPTGRAIAAAASPRFARLQLELGSNNPAIVLGDADIAHTAASLVSGAMKLSGQGCEPPRHGFVAREVHDVLVAALEAELVGLVIGPSTDDVTTLGPVAFPARRDELLAQRDAFVAGGARAVEVGSPPAVGCFVTPTLIVGERLAPASEIFGPLLLVEPFDSPDEAIEVANAGAVGLAGYVYTSDLEAGRALGCERIAGEVKLNGSSVLDMAPGSSQSFFGSSGIGGHGDRELLEFFTGVQVIGTDMPGLPL
ncbi:MAG: aldehyde dehydrogenase family protein [Actinobacteria bacterium]|nr:aldehyde dehydrogenase family protein [Actinomycetota bacterium]